MLETANVWCNVVTVGFAISSVDGGLVWTFRSFCSWLLYSTVSPLYVAIVGSFVGTVLWEGEQMPTALSWFSLSLSPRVNTSLVQAFV